MNIIGICGRAGAGKDTAADVLVAKFGFVKIGLADPMKRACAEWFQWDYETLWGPSEKRNELDERFPLGGSGVGFLSARYALQKLGTEFGRACYENVWVDIAIRTAAELAFGVCYYDPMEGLTRPPGPHQLWPGATRRVVIPDVRFPNEVAAIKKAGGRIWKIIRPGAGLEGDAGKHVSEAHADGIEVDFTFDNNGTLDEFQTMIAAMEEPYGLSDNRKAQQAGTLTRTPK